MINIDVICDMCHKFLNDDQEATENLDGYVWCQDCLDNVENEY